MAITKFTNDKGNNKYEDVIPNTEDEMDSTQIFMKKLADKVDESLDETNKFTVGSNTTISFGDMITTVTGKAPKTTTTYTIVMTVRKSGVSKSTTLTLT